MTGQMTLDDAPRARARRHDPQSSYDAAAAATPGVSETQRLLLVLMAEVPMPLTDDVLALWGVRVDLRGWPRKSSAGLRTRRAELCARGHVVAVGKAKNAAGNAVTLWSLAGAE